MRRITLGFSCQLLLPDHSVADFRNVTICAADSIHASLAARALEISMAQCHFADAILFTHEPIDTHARTVLIPKMQSKADYSTFMIRDLPRYVNTPWVLIVQWDGYVIDASAWQDSFFEYDYIGARWPFHAGDGMDVGNGGFSLRSLRLIQALSDPKFPILPGVNEDDLICRVYRKALEADHGIRFATAPVADAFAYEYLAPDTPTFGFHSACNLWRHIDDVTMMNMIHSLEWRTFASSEMLQLMIHYSELRKFDCVRTMCRRYLGHWSPEQLLQNLFATGVIVERVRHCAEICARVMQAGKTTEKAGT
jgi:hypothetical protein